MSKFELIETSIENLKVIQRLPIKDSRGFLERVFCTEDLKKLSPSLDIKQINHTLTNLKGSIRGLHFQKAPYYEDKIVTCLKGQIFDVAVDLRENSPTYLKWFGIELTDTNFRSLFIPKGFAHGFQTLSDNVELLYLHTEFYKADSESGINPFDAKIAIPWPLSVSEISDRDKNLSMITSQFMGIKI